MESYVSRDTVLYGGDTVESYVSRDTVLYGGDTVASYVSRDTVLYGGDTVAIQWNPITVESYSMTYCKINE